MKLFDTNLPHNFSKGLYEECDLTFNAQYIDKVIDVIFTGTVLFLNGAKKIDTPVALVFEREDKSVIAAAIVQYFDNDDKSNPGNWNLVFTLDENDIPENANIFYASNPSVHPFLRSVAADKYHFIFDAPNSLVLLPRYFFENLRKWLDENAKENEEISIDLDGVFQARAAVEGGEKVFSIEPAGEIKMLIKDDSAIEK